MGLRDDILQIDDLPTESVEVPEWGMTLFVRSMNGCERDQYEVGLMDTKDLPLKEKLKNANISYLERVFLKTGIDKPTMIRIKESSDRLPGVEIVDIYLREYNYGVLGSHILGYTGEIDEERLASELYSGDYSGGDQIGLTGLEEKYESMLRGEKGEIVIQGDNVMKGYYKNERATKETLKQGWLFTGDIGFFDEDDFLVVVGREKALLISEDGEKYSPEEIEEAIVNCSSLIQQVMIYNDHKKFTTALLTLNHKNTTDWIKGNSMVSYEEILKKVKLEKQKKLQKNNNLKRRSKMKLCRLLMTTVMKSWRQMNYVLITLQKWS